MSSLTPPKRFVTAARVNDLQNGKMMSVSVENRDLLVALINGKYYAVNSKCPHLGGNLAMGRLEGTVVTCPRHGSKFDLADGRVIRWTIWTGLVARASEALRSPRPLRVYPVKVEGDDILIGI